jgi:hypothetical protein
LWSASWARWSWRPACPRSAHQRSRPRGHVLGADELQWRGADAAEHGPRHGAFLVFGSIGGRPLSIGGQRARLRHPTASHSTYLLWPLVDGLVAALAPQRARLQVACQARSYSRLRRASPDVSPPGAGDRQARAACPVRLDEHAQLGGLPLHFGGLSAHRGRNLGHHHHRSHRRPGRSTPAPPCRRVRRRPTAEPHLALAPTPSPMRPTVTKSSRSASDPAMTTPTVRPSSPTPLPSRPV